MIYTCTTVYIVNTLTIHIVVIYHGIFFINSDVVKQLFRNPISPGVNEVFQICFLTLPSPLSPRSDRPDADPPLFQHGVRGGGDGAALHPQTLQGVLPQLLHHAGLRSVHHGHAAREANVYKGNT